MMSDKIEPMTLDRLRELIEAYGANPERWPEQERGLAVVFIATSAEAQGLLEEAVALDRALDALPAPEPSQALRNGILNAFTPAKPVAANENDGLVATITRWRPRSHSAWHKAAAAAVMFGVLCGVGVSQVYTTTGTIVIAQQPFPQFIQPIPEQPLQNGVAALTLDGEIPAILADTVLQPEATTDEASEDPEVPLT
jgi:hypothetical protein